MQQLFNTNSHIFLREVACAGNRYRRNRILFYIQTVLLNNTVIVHLQGIHLLCYTT